MNKPFITVVSNSARPYQWKVQNLRGEYEALSGRFASRETAQKWITKWQQESPAFGCR